MTAPTKREAFKALAEARARLHDENEFGMQEAADKLQENAKVSGLVDEIGQDAVQEIMSEAFAPYQDNGGNWDPTSFEQLCDKAVEDKRARERRPTDGNRGEVGHLESARASTIKMSAVHWLWPNRFALGKLGLIAGLPDEGKGQILAYMAARITGEDPEWPCGEGRAPQGNVVLLTAEDDSSDTVVPRLASAGANLDRVEIIRMVRHADKARMFSLITDLPLLREKVLAVGNVKQIQIDPVSAYLGVKKWIASAQRTSVPCLARW
jgi:AAA domain